LTEDQLEQEALGWLADVGNAQAYGPDIAPDGAIPECADYRQVLLIERLRRAIETLNSNCLPQCSSVRPRRMAGAIEQPDQGRHLAPTENNASRQPSCPVFSASQWPTGAGSA
jgi:hypothetical protein